MSRTGSEICPHVCSNCGSACYVGLIEITCVNMFCKYYEAKTLEAFQQEYLKAESDAGSDLFEDADTNPQWGIGAVLKGDD